MTEVDRHAQLAGVHADEVRALVVAVGVERAEGAAHLVALAGALHFDHARAHVGEQPSTVGAGQHAREVEDGDAGEERGRVGHGLQDSKRPE